MSEATIDSLQIEIKSSADSAKSSIEKLADSLNKLKTATSNATALDSVATALDRLNTALSPLNSATIDRLNELAKAINSFKGLGSVKLNDDLAYNIRRIIQAMSNSATFSVNSLANMGSALQNFKGLSSAKINDQLPSQIEAVIKALQCVDDDQIVNAGLLATYLYEFNRVKDITIPMSLGDGIRNLGTALEAANPSKFGSLYVMVTQLSYLRDIQDITISDTLGISLVNIAIAAEQLGTVDLTSLNGLATALKPLSEIGDAKNLTSILKQLQKLPEVFSKLNTTALEDFEQKAKKLASALSPLATQINAIGDGFSKLPNEIQQCVAAMKQMPSATDSAKRSSTNLLSSVKLLYSSLKGVVSTIGDAITKSNKYVETMNLFNASLGEYAQQAQEYAEMVGEKVGIDPADWMEAQGVFYNLADGFGIASDRAYTMSQQLTQLSYDLASFYNISVEDAMLKLRGSLSGEIEMMRQLGVDLSAAAMQERATAMGIQTKVSAMTQAEKAQLRYQILMERTTTAQGDMARTLMAPANQLRVLSAQVTQAARAFGNIFIPILNSVLPVVIALAKAVRFLAACIASLFGYSLPEVEYSTGGLSTAASSAGDLSDNLGSAGGNAKKLKNALMGFDEINKLPEDSSGGGGGGGGSGGGGGLDGFDWDLATYDFLDGLVSTKIDEIYAKIEPFVNWVKENIEVIGSIIEAIGVSLLMWKFSSSFLGDVSVIKAFFTTLGAYVMNGAVIFVSAMLSWQYGNKFQETGNFGYIGADIISTSLLSVLSGKILQGTLKKKGAGLWGAAINLGVSAITTLATIYKGIKNNRGENTFSTENIVSSLWASVKGGFAGGLIAKATGVSWVAGGGIGAAITLTAAAAIMIVKTKVELENKAKDMLWGSISLTAEEIQSTAASLLSGIDVEATVNVLTSSISDAEQAKSDLNQKVTEFSTLINPITLGVEPSEEDIQSIKDLLDPTSEKSLLGALQTQLDTSTLLIKTTLNFVPATDSEGGDQSANVLGALVNIDQEIMDAATDAGQKLSMLLSEGFGEGLDASVQEQVANLSYWIQKIANGAENAEIRADFEVSTAELLKGLDRDSFSSVLSEYTSMSEELETSLREASLESKTAMQTKVYQLTSAAEYYDSQGMEDKAKELRAQIAEYQEIIDAWDVDASVAKAMEEYTAEGKAQVLAALREIFTVDESKVDWFDTYVRDLGELWIPMLENGEKYTFEDDDELKLAAESLASNFQTAVSDIFSKEDLGVLQQTADALGTSLFNVLPTDLQERFITYLSELVDPSQIVPLFSELGYEITPEVLAIFDKLGVEIPQEIREGIEGGSQGIEEATEGLGESVVDGIDGVEPEVKQASEELGQSVTDGAESGVSNNVGTVLNQVGDMVSAIKKKFSGSKLGETVSDLIGKLKNKNTKTTSTVTVNVEQGTGWSSIPTNSDVEYTIDLKKGWSGTLQKWISSSWSKTFKVELEKTSKTLTWTGKVRQVAASDFEFSMRKNGGYVRNGEMFIANEAGAEMVGRIGRKSAVANESQIGDAIFRYMDAHDSNDGVNEESLARAIVTGLKQAGIGSVYLNGRDMADAINAETKRAGRSAIVF